MVEARTKCHILISPRRRECQCNEVQTILQKISLRRRTIEKAAAEMAPARCLVTVRAGRQPVCTRSLKPPPVTKTALPFKFIHSSAIIRRDNRRIGESRPSTALFAPIDSPPMSETDWAEFTWQPFPFAGEPIAACLGRLIILTLPQNCAVHNGTSIVDRRLVAAFSLCAWGLLPGSLKAEGRPMSVRTLDSSGLEPIPFSLPMSSYAIPPAAAPALSEEEEWPADEIPTASGCLRGFCWAIGIECATACCAYAVWRLWQFLR
jgi:hypothetical protein